MPQWLLACPPLAGANGRRFDPCTTNGKGSLENVIRQLANFRDGSIEADGFQGAKRHGGYRSMVGHWVVVPRTWVRFPVLAHIHSQEKNP